MPIVIVASGRRAALQVSQQFGQLLFYPPADTTTAGDDDYATLSAIPSGWGNGEFALGFRVRLSQSMATGTAINRWSTENSAPYSGSEWWFNLNFLFDWFNNSSFESGSFGFGFRNSGRPCWLIGDGAQAAARTGGVHGVYSASAASLLDGEEHEIKLVGRNSGASSRVYEMWVDHTMAASETSGARTSMFTTYWSGLGASDIILGAEKISALGGTPWFKYAGAVRDIRFWTRALSEEELGDPDEDENTEDLVARFRMQAPEDGEIAADVGAQVITVVPGASPAWGAV